MANLPFRTITPNGTEILIEPMPHVKSCSVGFWVKFGSCSEHDGEEGLGHFIEHAVFKGTELYRKPQIIAEATDRLGGNVDAFTGKETTCFYGKVIKEQLPNLVNLLGDLITTPRFEADELNRERKVILEEINQSEDQPDDWVNELFYTNFWPDGTLGHSILGTKEMIANYEVTQVKNFFNKTYRAPNILIAATGDVQVDAFLTMLNPVLSKLPPEVNGLSMKPNKA
jgi:predicted Zn-dependent peptidase